MRKTLILLFSLVVGTSFSQIEDSLFTIIKGVNIDSLKSDESRIQFLENLHDIDQGIRQTFVEIEQTYGYKSPEYELGVKKWKEVDS